MTPLVESIRVLELARILAPGVRSAIVVDGAPAASARPAPSLGEPDAEVLDDPAWGGPSPSERP